VNFLLGVKLIQRLVLLYAHRSFLH
jgi:hypothetical protein